MYVRKFEAETMEEALKSIKQELGPDAIILKTMTNKGFKGAFKKNRIEITAAISEKSYTKKATVDKNLNPSQKEKFYNSPASYISNMLDNNSNEKKNSPSPTPSYSQMGLNKSVKAAPLESKKETSSTSDLDNFLSSFEGAKKSQPIEVEEFSSYDDEELTQAVSDVHDYRVQETSTNPSFDVEEYEAQKRKIDELERKLFEVSKGLERVNHQEPIGIYELRAVLRSLQISEVYIQKLAKKAIFELSKEDTMDPDIVFEFALREMYSEIKTEMPLFSDLEGTEAPVVTVLISDSSSGQSSMALKLGALKGDSVVIRSNSKEAQFTESFLGIDTVNTQGIPEIITATRKTLENNKNAFIDFKNPNAEFNEVKKFIDGLRRSFGRVEVLVCLSSIHSEMYNMQMMNRYGQLADGLVFTNLDLCLNFGSLFNIAVSNQSIPVKFFGTGDVVPDDIETATAERILSGMFNLK